MESISRGSQNITMSQIVEPASVAETPDIQVSSQEPAASATESATAPIDSFAHKEGVNSLVGTARKTAVAGAFNPAAGKMTLASTRTAAADKVDLPDSLQPKALEQSAKQLAAWLDVSKAMTVGAYNKVVTDLDDKAGFFMQAVNVANLQIKDIDKKLAELGQMENPDQVQLEQLQQLKNLASGMVSMYTNLSQAGSPKEANRTKDVQTLFNDIVAMQNALAGLDPDIVGDEAVNSVRNSLAQITELAMAFPTIQTNPNCMTPSRQLGVFFAMTFRRLRQINDGQRVRSNETNDMTGALKTYENDAKDCTKRMAMFANIRKKVLANGITDKATIASMLREAIKGAPALNSSIEIFAESYANLALADIHHKEARANLASAQQSLHNAQGELQSAQNKLLEAQGAIQGSKILLSAHVSNPNLENAVKQRTNQDARSLYHYASNCNAQAGEHIQNFYQYKKEGQQYANVAQSEAEVAGRYLNVAAEANGVIKAGSHGKYFQQETGKVDAHIGQARADLAATYAGAQDVKEQFTQLDAFAVSLLANQDEIANSLKNLDATISMVELVDKTAAMSRENVKQAYHRVTNTITAYATAHNVKLSADLKAFLKDPDGYLAAHPGEEGNMREEMNELFADHPELAEKVAQDMAGIKKDFQAARKTLEGKLKLAGQDPNSPALKAQLDALENSLVNGLLNTNPYLFSSMMAGSTKKTAALNDMMNWLQNSQMTMVDHMVGDPRMRQEAISQFDAMLSNEAFKDVRNNLEQRKAEYGAVKSKECLSVYMSDSGAIRSMNVYIFEKGGKFYALDPMTNNVYKGATKDAAMDELASSYNQVNGQVSYADAHGKVHSYAVSKPKDSLAMDVGMTLTGIAGGLLMLVPEPTMATKVAGYGCIATSASYFISKGTTAIIEQVSHDNFDLNNKASRDALFDVISGLLSAVGGAGTALKGGSTAVMAGRGLSTAMSTSSKLGKVAVAMGRAGDAWTFSSSMTSFGENMVGILTDKSLSDEQKADAVAGQLALLVPNMVSSL